MKITQQQIKVMIAEELSTLDEDLGKAVIDAIMDKFRSKPEPEPEEEPEPEPEEKPTRRPYDHNHPDHPDHPDNIRDRRRRRQSAADSKAYWSRTTDDIYGKRYKNPKGQFRQYTAGGYTRENIERIIKEELEDLLMEDGQGCADTDKGCIRKRESGWVILNNKKGGVWRKCDSHSHCEEILDAFHASKG